MAAGAWKVYGNAVEKIADGTIDLDTDTFRMVLLTSAYTPNQSTHTAWSNVSTAEVSGTGYDANGKLITQSVSRSNLVVTFNCDDQSWPSSTITTKYAVIVRDADGDGTLVAGDLLLCYSDLDTGGGSLSTVDGTFSVSINESGVFTITAS